MINPVRDARRHSRRSGSNHLMAYFAFFASRARPVHPPLFPKTNRQLQVDANA
jgi:hypothetical protein